jgi:hypothetical protein
MRALLTLTLLLLVWGSSCGCSNTVQQIVRYPYPIVEAHVLANGGKVLDNGRWRGCELTVDEGSSDGGNTRDHTWIRASEAGISTTKIEVESVKNVAFTYWQKGKERRRLKEFLKDLNELHSTGKPSQ